MGRHPAGGSSSGTELIDAPEQADIDAATTSDFLYGRAFQVSVGLLAVTAVVFVVWLFRARVNAERLIPMRHGRRKYLLIAGWIIPIICWWYPKQIVDDIWAVSKTAAAGHRDLGDHTLDTERRSGLVRAWWLCWLAWNLYGWVGRFVGTGDDLQSIRDGVVLDLCFLVVSLAAAALAVAVIMKISAFQETARSQPTPEPVGQPAPSDDWTPAVDAVT